MSTSLTPFSTSAKAGSSTGCSTPSPSKHVLKPNLRSTLPLSPCAQKVRGYPDIMIRERELIARLRRLATAPEARGLLDDVALLDRLVITHDTIAERVDFVSTAPPASVGWKLVAVNLSDLAAKGATPAGALLSLTISGNDEWEAEFLTGVEAACESYALPLIGGDTIALPDGAPHVLGLTAIGRGGEHVPHRAGGKPGN